MQRGDDEHTKWVRSVDPTYDADTTRKAKPVACAADDVFVSMAAMKVTLETIASVVAPLVPRLEALEKKLRALESKSMGTHIHAGEVSVDGLQGLGEAVARLNATLTLPVKPIYDDRGILVGARRVPYLDS